MPTVKGNAGWRYTPVGGAFEYLVPLNAPLYDIAPAFVGLRFAHENLLRTSIDVVEIASGVQDITCRIAYEKASWSLLRMLEAGARGATLNYYPDLSLPSEFYPVRLMDAGDEIRLTPDSQMWRWGRYERVLRLRRVDGGTLEPLYAPLLFRYFPGLDWTASTFSRTTVAWQRRRTSPNGFVLEQKAIGALRDHHSETNPVTGKLDRATLIEVARTNVTLHNRDLTNAAWVKTGCTATKDQAGPDNVASSASKLVATAAAATCLQARTFVSAARIQSTWIKRLVGTGVIDMTMDGGTTWVALTLTSSWARVSIPSQTVTDPSMGFRIATSGDEIAVDFVQNEVGASITSEIATTTASVTRPAEDFRFPWLLPPQEMTVYARFIERGTRLITSARLLEIGGVGSPSPRLVLLQFTGGVYRIFHQTLAGSVASTAGTAVTEGQLVEICARLYPDGAVQLGQALNGAAEVLAAKSAALALAEAWGGLLIGLGCIPGGTGNGAVSFVGDDGAAKIARGILSMAEMRSR